MKAVLRTLCGCEREIEVDPGTPEWNVRIVARHKFIFHPDPSPDAIAPILVRRFRIHDRESNKRGMPVYMEEPS